MSARLLANRPERPVSVPGLVHAAAPKVGSLDAVWRNELGGLTFRDRDRFLKWNPRGCGVDLNDERDRLLWAAPRHPVAEVLDFVEDSAGQLLATRARPREAVRAIADGLRALHELPAEDCPFVCDWEASAEVPTADFVVVQGDACAPNRRAAHPALPGAVGCRALS